VEDTFEIDFDAVTDTQIQEPGEAPVIDMAAVTGLGSASSQEEPVIDMSKVVYTPDDVFFKERQKEVLGNVGIQFGGATKIGRGTRQMLRSIFDPDGVDDFSRLNDDLEDLKLNHPERADSEYGQAYQKDMRKRARSVLDEKELDISDTVKLLVNKAVDSPGELLEALGEGMLEDPTLPLLFAAAYSTGGAASGAVAQAGGLTRLVTLMANSTSTTQRAASVALNGAIRTAGVMGAEGTLGYMYEVGQNTAIGRDPQHNAAQMAGIGAIVGGGYSGLGTGFKLLKGIPGRYKSIEEGMMDLKNMRPKEVPEMVNLLTENMTDLPKASATKAFNSEKLRDIASKLAPFNPLKPLKDRTLGNLGDLKGRIKHEFDLDPNTNNKWFAGVAENKSMGNPVGHIKGNKVYYNPKEIFADFDAGFRYMQGLTKAGTKGTNKHTFARGAAFEELGFSFKTYREWLVKNKGMRTHTEFLMRLESNRLKYTGGRNSLKDGYIQAIKDTMHQMGTNPKRFHSNRTVRAGANLKAGVKYVGRTAYEKAQHPEYIYEAVKDTLLDAKRFATDVVYGPVESSMAWAKARREMTHILRDWEGGRMAGELPINDFANFVKGRLQTQDKLNAVSHYLEGNLEGYNAARIANNQKAIELTAGDKEVAVAIRKYFNDMFDWAQRADLFTSLRQDKKLYAKARGLMQAGQSNKFKTNKQARDEVWDFVKGLDDPRKLAYDLSSPAAQKAGKGYDLKFRDNYVTHATKKRFAPTENDILESVLEDIMLADPHRASQLQTVSRYTKKRSHETLQDAKDAGVSLLTEDISQLVRMYGKSMLRAQLNKRLLNQLGKMRSLDTGKPMIGRKHEVPDYYVEFKHPNFKEGENHLFVNPNIAPDLRLYFDTSDPWIINRVLQNIVMISKRAALGFSGFHMMALAWSGLAAGQNPLQIAKNVLPLGNKFRSKGLLALAGEEGHHELIAGMRNGLSIGVLEELKGDTLINAIRRIGQMAEDYTSSNKYIKPLGKTFNVAAKTTARAQEIIDAHLWDHVNTGLKATTYLTALEKIILRDARLAAKQGRRPTDKDILRQRAAQFTNDAFGNQNWNQMAMNVENFMGHRIAAALNKPSMRGYIRMLVFAPDWTTSNMRVLGKALHTADAAHEEYMKYAVRSALLFAFVGEVLQQASGQGSLFDSKDLYDVLHPDLGDGKQITISKQTSEVPLILSDILKYAPNKLGTLPKMMMEDSAWGAAKFGVESSLPIGLRQWVNDPEYGASGIAGIPITRKWE